MHNSSRITVSDRMAEIEYDVTLRVYLEYAPELAEDLVARDRAAVLAEIKARMTDEVNQ